MGDVVAITDHPRFRQEREPLRSKRQMAEHYNHTTRWVELQMVAGAPYTRTANGHARFRLSSFDEWLQERRAS